MYLEVFSIAWGSLRCLYALLRLSLRDSLDTFAPLLLGWGWDGLNLGVFSFAWGSLRCLFALLRLLPSGLLDTFAPLLLGWGWDGLNLEVFSFAWGSFRGLAKAKWRPISESPTARRVCLT